MKRTIESWMKRVTTKMVRGERVWQDYSNWCAMKRVGLLEDDGEGWRLTDAGRALGSV